MPISLLPKQLNATTKQLHYVEKSYIHGGGYPRQFRTI
jgi:hypothetical protein